MRNVKGMMKKVHRGEGGFTLVELLIVIVILGIIGAVVALNVGGFLGAGTKEAAMMEKDAVQTSILAGMAESGCGQLTAGTFTAGDTSVACAAGGDISLEKYMQGSTTGSWDYTAGGLVSGGSYEAGGTNCTYSSGSWNCTAT